MLRDPSRISWNQNLKSPASFKWTQLYQPTEPSLPVKLQVVLSDLQDIQTRPLQVYNFDKIGFYPNGKWNKMVWTYKLFTGESLYRNHPGERERLWCIELIFACINGLCFIPPVVVHQRNHYTQNLYHNIPSDWVIHNSPSGYIDPDGWHKSMFHFLPWVALLHWIPKCSSMMDMSVI